MPTKQASLKELPPIFIIENDLNQLEILAEMLGEEPYPVLSAMTGTYALEELENIVPALVLVDLVMPDISGEQIIRYIRADERFKDTKIIIVTSHLFYVSPEDRRLTDGVLLKSVAKDALIRMVQPFLGVATA